MAFLRKTLGYVCAWAMVIAPAVVANGCGGDVTPTPAGPGDGGTIVDAGGDSTVSSEPPPIDPPPGPTDIVGSLFDSRGTRVNNATVTLDGATTPLDAWGRFVVRNAPPTYSLAVGSPGNGAQVFDGATTRTPDVTVPGLSSTFTPIFAPLNIAYPPPDQPGAQFITYVYDPGGILSWQNSVSTMDIEIDPRTTATVSVYVIEYLQPDNSKPPTQFLGSYEQTGVVLDMNQPAHVNPTMTPVTSQNAITTNPTTEAGMTVYEAYLFARPKGATQAPTLFNTWALLNAPTTWAFDIPQIGDLEWFIGYQAWETGQQGSFGGGGSGIVEPVGDDGSTVSPVLPKAPFITSPSQGATFDIGTTIAWTSEESVCSLQMAPQGGAADSGFWITTTANSITVPDLSAVGSSLQSGATYQAYLSCGEPAVSGSDADPDFGVRGGASSNSSYNFTLVAQ